MTTATERPTYVEAAEAATILRAELRKTFPATRFSVRTSTTGTIRVRWTDGPSKRQVDEVAQPYAGRDFDPTTDSVLPIQHRLDGEPVHLLTSYVFCDRRITYDFARNRWRDLLASAGTHEEQVQLTSKDGTALVVASPHSLPEAWSAADRVVRALAEQSAEEPELGWGQSRLEVVWNA